MQLIRPVVFLLTCLVGLMLCSAQFVPFKTDGNGNLVAREDLRSMVDRQIAYYVRCGGNSTTHGYPTWISNAFMNGDCEPDGLAVLPGWSFAVGWSCRLFSQESVLHKLCRPWFCTCPFLGRILRFLGQPFLTCVTRWRRIWLTRR